jgi:hypothetical protein
MFPVRGQRRGRRRRSMGSLLLLMVASGSEQLSFRRKLPR